MLAMPPIPLAPLAVLTLFKVFIACRLFGPGMFMPRLMLPLLYCGLKLEGMGFSPFMIGAGELTSSVMDKNCFFCLSLNIGFGGNAGFAWPAAGGGMAAEVEVAREDFLDLGGGGTGGGEETLEPLDLDGGGGGGFSAPFDGPELRYGLPRVVGCATCGVKAK